MVLEVYVIIGSLVIFLTENNIPKSMNTDRHLGRDRFESTASAGRRMPPASPIDLPVGLPIPEDPLPSSAKGGGKW